MSQLIKSKQADRLTTVRSLSHALPPRVSVADQEREELRRRIGQLEAEARERDVRMAALRNEAQAMFEQGRAEGRDVGLEEADRREAERLERIDIGVRGATAMFAESLESLERLSTLLARDCLEIILADPDYRIEQLRKLIGSQVGKIEASSLITLMVAQADFPDDQSLKTLSEHIRLDAGLVTSSADIPSGSCRLSLRLGELEIGIDQQWGVLRDRLTQLSEPKP